jgi:hypothetical protein
MARSADPEDPVKNPENWDKCVSVAYLRLIGQTQEQAADSAGVGVRTVHTWEHCSWWADCQAEASRRWLVGLEAKARATLQEGMDANIALKILERRLPELAPPTQKTDLTTDGKPLPEKVVFEFIEPGGDDD